MMMALKRKDVNAFFQIYQDVILKLPSYHDLRNENSYSMPFGYHLLMLGMCAWLSSDYTILSNRENGRGRADSVPFGYIILKERREGLPNIVIEFKYSKKESTTDKDLENLAKEGLNQIKDKNYTIDLQGDTICIGLAHHGKFAMMKYEEISLD